MIGWLLGLPLDLVSPVGGRHLPLFNIAGMAGFKAFTLSPHLTRLPRFGFACGLSSLLPKPNSLNVVPLFSNHNVALLGVVGSSLWFIETTHPRFC